MRVFTGQNTHPNFSAVTSKSVVGLSKVFVFQLRLFVVAIVALGFALSNAQAQTTVSITDAVDFESAAAANGFTFTISLSDPSPFDVSVQFDTADNTAIAPADYKAQTSKILTIPAGQTTVDVTVTVLDETLYEDDETFYGRISNVIGFATIAKAQGIATLLNDDSQPRLVLTRPTLVEGNSGTTNMNFSVLLTEVSGKDVTVQYDTFNIVAPNAATAPEDYMAQVDQILTIPAGQSSGIISVPIEGDTIFETDEVFGVKLSFPVDAGIQTGTNFGTITNDDAIPEVSVSDASVVETDTDTPDMVFTVTLSALSYQDVRVQYDTSDVTATAGVDYTAQVAKTVTIPAGQLTGTFSVPVKGDTLDEPNETLTATLSVPSNCTILDGVATGTILDDDNTPSLSITNATLNPEGNAGTTNLNFTVTLSWPTLDDVTVQYDVGNGTAKASSDFISQLGQTLTIPAGQTSAIISVAVLGDTINESNETVRVRLSSPFNATILRTTGVGTIVDDDPQPTVSIGNVFLNPEGNSGTLDAVFTVSLSTVSGQTVTVDYATIDGTAKAPEDYQSTTGTLTFAAGETTKTLTIPVVSDVLDESNETFRVQLSNLVNTGAGNLTGTAFIVDDDTSVLSVANKSIVEGNSGTRNLVFTVALSNPSIRTITVNYTTADGTANAPADYTSKSGTLTFTSGQTTQNVSVPVIGETIEETDETLSFRLSNATNATIAVSSVTGTIKDDDRTYITIDDQSVIEGDSGTTAITFTVKLSGGSAKTVQVQYATQDGTASSASDYSAASGLLTFSPGETSKQIVVNVSGDTLYEANETLRVNLSAPINGVISDAQGAGTITNDDTAPLVSINDITVTENNSGAKNMQFTVTLSAASGRVVTADFATADGTAIAGQDYTATSGKVTFPIGQISKTIVIPLIGDTLDEDDETLFVNLNNTVNATIADSQGVGTITDNDASPSLSIDDVTVVEGDTGRVNAIFSVNLSAASGRVTTVDYATQNNTALSGDYVASSGSLTFAAGETAKTITIKVKGETVDEIDETFFVNLSNAVNATVTDSQGVGTITDDDVAPFMTINDVTVTEGDSGNVSAIFTVSISSVSGKTVTVDYATTDGTATTPDDYIAKSGTLTFTPGQTTRTVTVLVRGETLGETDESFFVNLSNAVNTTVADGQGIGTIDDDDSFSALTLVFAKADASGSSITLNFSGAVNAGSAVNVTNYTVTADGVAVPVQNAAISTLGTSVYLTWPPKTLPIGSTVVVAWRLTDAYGLPYNDSCTLTAK